MSILPQLQRRLARSRWLPWLVIAFAITILGGTVWQTTEHVRRTIREQIASRDGEILYAVARMQQRQSEGGSATEPPLDVTQPADQLSLVFKISQLKGVMGVRLFGTDGKFITGVPASVQESTLTTADLATLNQLKPLSHFRPAISLDEVFLQLPDGTRAAAPSVPLLEVNVPLHSGDHTPLAGIAQFIIQGNSIAAEFERLDQNLLWQAGVAFTVGSLLLIATLGWAFRRLAQRTADLQRANQELAMAVKTSALGAVTAHLIHELKNPLFGLHQFVTTQGQGEEGEWQQAAAAARRMQTMINTVVAVLREEKSGAHYELSLPELTETIASRTQSVAKHKGVRLSVQTNGAANLPGRDANLMILIVVNLVENAIQATPPGKTVHLTVTANAGTLLCEVRDEGPGLAEVLRPTLFTPCPSDKPGGTGLGLAISKQLANHLGAELELKSSSTTGCIFCLSLRPGASTH